MIKALMLRHIPAEWIAGALVGQGFGTILLSAFIGALAYSNCYGNLES